MVSHSMREGVCVLKLSGEININNLNEVRNQIDAFNLGQYDHIIVNLAEVSLFDSSGLGYLVVLITHAQRRSAKMSLCEPSELVRSLLTNIRIDKHVDIFDTEEEAVRQARAPA